MTSEARPAVAPASRWPLTVAVLWSAVLTAVMLVAGAVGGFGLATVLIGLPSLVLTAISAPLLAASADPARRQLRVLVLVLCAASALVAMVSFVLPLFAVIPTAALLCVACLAPAKR